MPDLNLQALALMSGPHLASCVRAVCTAALIVAFLASMPLALVSVSSSVASAESRAAASVTST